jgi:sporulation protein YlmC with PRC-barrel domain/CBS domain-containing protein
VTDPPGLWLSELLGRRVTASDGSGLGKVTDLELERWGGHPPVAAIAVARGQRAPAHVAWSGVESIGEHAVTLAPAATVVAGELAAPGLLLGRDVLDAQVVDIAGKRLRRVSDVWLARSDGGLRVVAVDTGRRALLRRLGLPLRRAAPDADGTAIDADAVHFAASRGHELQLATSTPALHRLSAAELSELVARLSPVRGAEVLERAGPSGAAGALSKARPRLGGRLLGELPSPAAGRIVEEMPVDDAVAALRHLRRDRSDAVLARVPGARAAELRRLLALPATTAGGLMTTDFRVARAGETADAIRRRLSEDPPALEGLTTVFLVGPDGRLEGAVGPGGLLAGSSEPRRVTALRVDTPVSDVIDAFAVEDVLALPVVDPDGRPVGAVAIDDVLEELLVERLPQHRRRYRRARGRRRAPA